MVLSFSAIVITGLSVAILAGVVFVWRQSSILQSLRLSEKLALDKLAEQSARYQDMETRLESYRQQCHELEQEKFKIQAELSYEKIRHQEKLEELKGFEQRLNDVFKLVSSEALQQSSDSFLKLAEGVFSKYEAKAQERLTGKQEAIGNLVKPIYTSLERFDERVRDIEKQRVGAYEGLTQQVSGLIDLQKSLQSETANLANALRSPTIRGKWGELQLKRVVEVAGMLAHCDFYEQAHMAGEQGAASLRPDMVVRLPGGRSIVVDAKAPLKAYFEAMDVSTDEARLELMRKHAQLIRKQITALSQKSYWSQLENSPEFVLLFLPGESYFSAALQADPHLIEAGAESKVIIATPTTLIALLRTAALSWRQEAMAENARHIAKLGRELYQRMGDLSSHLHDTGKHLKSTVNAYNKAVGTVESRLFVSARRFKELQADDPKKDIKPLQGIDTIAREPALIDT